MNQKQYGLRKEIMSLGVMIVVIRMKHGSKAIQSYITLEEAEIAGAKARWLYVYLLW
jgi:hypothetical protein